MFSFKSFSDYSDHQAILEEKQSAEGRPARSKAKEKTKSRQANPFYSDNWYLLLRKGLYGAQIEKAMSELDALFLGYSTDIDLLKEGEDYYAASHEINYFRTWSEIASQTRTLPDGNLVFIDNDHYKPIIGMGKVFVLADFLGASDPHSGNWGIQIREKDCLVVQIDKADSLDFSEGGEEGEQLKSFEGEFDTGMFAPYSKIDWRQTDWYKREKQEILTKIATTDFSRIEAILRRNITSNKLEAAKWQLKRQLSTAATTEEAEGLREALQHLDGLDPSEGNVEAIVSALRKKHQALAAEWLPKAGAARAAGYRDNPALLFQREPEDAAITPTQILELMHGCVVS